MRDAGIKVGLDGFSALSTFTTRDIVAVVVDNPIMGNNSDIHA
jgi:hypothetical protein